MNCRRRRYLVRKVDGVWCLDEVPWDYCGLIVRHPFSSWASALAMAAAFADGDVAAGLAVR